MGKKIIVIDDSQTIREQVGTALRQAGFDIVEAVVAAEVLAAEVLLAVVGVELVFDLLLLLPQPASMTAMSSDAAGPNLAARAIIGSRCREAAPARRSSRRRLGDGRWPFPARRRE